MTTDTSQQFTSVDMANAMRYANQRAKLRRLLFISKQSLHVASWLKYEIRPANPTTDYYFPESFADKAIMVDITFTEQSCSKINCNVRRPDRACVPSDATGMYRLGQSSKYELNCQPPCYNLAKIATYNDDASMKTQSVRVEWVPNKNVCAMVPETAGYMELPRLRSMERYAKRLNDLALGFNLSDQRDETYGVTGRIYEFNEYYCQVYNKKFDPHTANCTESAGDWLVNSIVGENSMNMLTAAVNVLTNGTTMPTPPNLPPLPEVPANMLLENWRTDYNPDFIIPTVEVTLSDLKMRPLNPGATRAKRSKRSVAGTESLSDDSKVDPDKNIDNPDMISHDLYENTYLKANELKKCMPTLQRRQFDKENASTTAPTNVINPNDPPTQDPNETNPDTNSRRPPSEFWEKLGAVINGLLKMLVTPDFYKSLGVNLVFDSILYSIKLALTSMSNRFIPMLLESIMSGTEALLGNVLRSAIVATITNTFMEVTMKIISKTLIILTKVLAEVVTIVGIVFIVLQVLDLIFMFWDPLGFQNMFNKDIMTQINFNGELALRRQLGIAEPVMTFDILCFFLITHDDQLKLNLEMFVDIYDYLNSLTVNSEGTRIDKGATIDPRSQPQDYSTVVLAKRNVYTTKDLEEYEKDQCDRMEFWRTRSKKTLFVLSGAFIFFAVLQIWFMVMVVLICILAVIFLGYLNANVVVNQYLRASSLTFLRF